MRPGTADLRPLPRRVFRSFLAHRLGPMLPGSGDHPVDRLLVAGHPYHVVRAETDQTERSDVSSVAAVDTDDQTASARHHAELGDGHADQHRALAYRKLVHCHIFAVDRRQRHLDRTGELLQLLVRTDDGNPVGRHENGLGMRSIDTVTAPQDRNDRHAVAQTQVQLSEAAAYQRTVARHGQPGQMQMLRLRIGRTDDRAEFLLVQIGEEPFLETQELPFDPLPEQNQRQHHQSERNQRAEPGSAQMSHDRHQKHQRDENSQHDERHDQPVIESRIVPQRHEKPFAEVPQRERPQQRSHDEDGRRRRDQFAPETLELALDPRSVVARRDPDDAPQ